MGNTNWLSFNWQGLLFPRRGHVLLRGEEVKLCALLPGQNNVTTNVIEMAETKTHPSLVGWCASCKLYIIFSDVVLSSAAHLCVPANLDLCIQPSTVYRNSALLNILPRKSYASEIFKCILQIPFCITKGWYSATINVTASGFDVEQGLVDLQTEDAGCVLE